MHHDDGDDRTAQRPLAEDGSDPLGGYLGGRPNDSRAATPSVPDGSHGTAERLASTPHAAPDSHGAPEARTTTWTPGTPGSATGARPAEPRSDVAHESLAARTATAVSAPAQRLANALRAALVLAESEGRQRLVRRGESTSARAATKRPVHSAATRAASAREDADSRSRTPDTASDRSQNARNVFLVVATIAGLYMVISGLIQAFT